MPGFASDSMIATITTDLTKLRPIYIRIEKLLEALKEADSDNHALAVDKLAEGEFKRIDDLAKKMSSHTTKEEGYKVERKNLTTMISGKKLEKRETALKEALKVATTWTVTVNSDVDKFVTKRAAGSQFDKLQEEIKKIGVSAAVGGLRHISGNTWDWHLPGAGNYRVVGLANPHTRNIDFDGVYDHPASGGKSKVAGNAVPGY